MGSAESSAAARARKRASSRAPAGRPQAPDQVSSRASDVETVFRQRLRQCFEGTTIAAFARRAAIPDSTMRSFVDGKSLPTWETAVKIARAAGRPLDWFANAIDIGDLRTEQLGAGYNADFVLLPLYDVRASAGHGAWNDDERVSKLLAFSRKWLTSDLRVGPDSIVLIYVDGDSMAPTLADGDMVMVDRSQSQLRSDGMYVFTHDGTLLIKRLQRLAGGTVRVISDNPRFKEYELRIADFEGGNAPAALVGRVLWSGVRV